MQPRVALVLMKDRTQRKGKAMLDCGATDTCGGYETVEEVIDLAKDKLQRQEVARVDKEDRPNFKFGDGEQLQSLSRVDIDITPLGREATLAINTLGGNAKDVQILFSQQSMGAMGAIVNHTTGRAIFTAVNPNSTVQLDRTPGGQLWLDLLEPMPVVGDKNAIFDMSDHAVQYSLRE